jgi:hypothetical protein
MQAASQLCRTGSWSVLSREAVVQYQRSSTIAAASCSGRSFSDAWRSFSAGDGHLLEPCCPGRQSRASRKRSNLLDLLPEGAVGGKSRAGLQGARAGSNEPGSRGDDVDASSSDAKRKDLSQQRTVLKLARSDSGFDVIVGAQSHSQPLDVTIRILYSLAMYGGLMLVGKLICDAAGVDVWAGFRLDLEDFYVALLCALVPIFCSLVIHQ